MVPEYEERIEKEKGKDDIAFVELHGVVHRYVYFLLFVFIFINAEYSIYNGLQSNNHVNVFILRTIYWETGESSVASERNRFVRRARSHKTKLIPRWDFSEFQCYKRIEVQRGTNTGSLSFK